MKILIITHPISTNERILKAGEIVTVTDACAHDYIQLGWARATNEQPKQSGYHIKKANKARDTKC